MSFGYVGYTGLAGFHPPKAIFSPNYLPAVGLRDSNICLRREPSQLMARNTKKAIDSSKQGMEALRKPFQIDISRFNLIQNPVERSEYLHALLLRTYFQGIEKHGFR